jgi:hypothetical protein
MNLIWRLTNRRRRASREAFGRRRNRRKAGEKPRGRRRKICRFRDDHRGLHARRRQHANETGDERRAALGRAGQPASDGRRFALVQRTLTRRMASCGAAVDFAAFRGGGRRRHRAGGERCRTDQRELRKQHHQRPRRERSPPAPHRNHCQRNLRCTQAVTTCVRRPAVRFQGTGGFRPPGGRFPFGCVHPGAVCARTVTHKNYATTQPRTTHSAPSVEVAGLGGWSLRSRESTPITLIGGTSTIA